MQTSTADFQQYFRNGAHHVHLLDENQVARLVEGQLSDFTKIDSVFDSEQLSVSRITEPVIRFDNNFLIRELFIASLNDNVKLRYIAAFTCVRKDFGKPAPDKDARIALLDGIYSNWGIDPRKP